jgi:hypothetical protein
MTRLPVNQLNKLAIDYAGLEIRVQRLMKTACGQTCAKCPKVCCRPEMCRESLESPFLALVRKNSKPSPAWNPQKGWLGLEGCRLKVGRPPVCYEFLCNDILAGQKDENARTCLKSLACLLSQAGRKALGGDHLVAIMTQERLAKIKPQRLAARLAWAAAALSALEETWHLR